MSSERACVGKRKGGENKKITICKENSLAKDTGSKEKEGLEQLVNDCSPSKVMLKDTQL